MKRRNYTANDRVAEISKALKALAKRFEVPVIAISQLNRVAANQEPQMDHLRESGQLEQDADVILLMWKEEEAGIDYHYLKVEKQKNGRLGRVRLHLDGPHFEFSQMDVVHEEAV
jgi:replicative DNA helicase